MEPEIIGAALGGVAIGLGAVILMLGTGRIAGMSGIVSGLVDRKAGDISWRAVFVGGLIVGGLILSFIHPQQFSIGITPAIPLIVLAGLMVGFGARLGSGCTSGHGVCGVARFGPRSLVATVIFTVAGASAVFITNHLIGGVL